MPRGTKQEPSSFTKHIAEQVVAAMQTQQMTTQTLANKITVSRPQLYKMLQGAKHWDLDSYYEICEALGLDPVDEVQKAIKSMRKASLSVIGGRDNKIFDFDDSVDFDIAATDMPDTGEPNTP